MKIKKQKILHCLNRHEEIIYATVKPKTIKLVCIASLLITQHKGAGAKTSWLGIRIVCPSAKTCLSVECCFNELTP